MKTLDFNAKLEQKQQAAELEHYKQHMVTLLRHATQAEKVEIYESIRLQDKARFDAVTHPIIMRHCIWEVNAKGGENS